MWINFGYTNDALFSVHRLLHDWGIGDIYSILKAKTNVSKVKVILYEN